MGYIGSLYSPVVVRRMLGDVRLVVRDFFTRVSGNSFT